ncbi:MAG: STAS domain-containing protein [Candidatus Methylacidiphilales bacterium]|nr:STAS domain-containing protein [Candidatus Methylacidiphilales bacterium]
MEISENKSGKVIILSINGKLDGGTCSQLDAKVHELLDRKVRAVVVDCSGLTYVSSAGLRVLLQAAKRMKAVQGTICLSSFQDQVREVFELSGFEAIFKVFPTSEAAVEKLS